MRRDLAPIRRRVSDRFGEVPWRTAQVVGTNGKGSWVHYATRLLRRGGRTVVSYTSPHFTEPAERIAVDGRRLDPARLERLLAQESESVREELTPFELLFLLTLTVAREEGAEVVLLEAGMGGRWDATSSLPAECTMLTGVEPEHTRYLGETREAILREKLAQVPAESDLFGPPLEGSCRAVLEEIVREKHLGFHGVDGQGDALTRRLAVEYVGWLTGESTGALRETLREVDPPVGRRDTRSRHGRRVVLDVAHTPGAAADLVEDLRSMDPTRWWVVYGSLRGKRTREILRRLQGLAAPDRIIPTRPPSPRAMSLEDLRSGYPTEDAPEGFEDPLEAAKHALERSGPEDGLLVTGSFPLVGRLLEAWWS